MPSSLRTVLVVCALIAAPVAMRASDPVGVYAVIDKVVFEPNDQTPERVQIFGTFAMANLENRDTYLPPQRGYLYFKLPADKESTARNEWSDLKSQAGKRQVLAFGNRFTIKATVRKIDDKAANPDTYSTSLGVVKLRSDTSYAPIRSLLEK